MRIDKYLWCVRLCKTRGIASKQVTGNNVKINGQLVKPGKAIKIGDEIQYKVPPIWKSFKILDIPKSRVSAKLVPDLIIETTPQDQLEILQELVKQNRENRLNGLKGRPTKKDQRDLEQFLSFDELEEDWEDWD